MKSESKTPFFGPQEEKLDISIGLIILNVGFEYESSQYLLIFAAILSSQWRVTEKVGKKGCHAAEVVNGFINFGVINLYYVPFREVTAAES